MSDDAESAGKAETPANLAPAEPLDPADAADQKIQDSYDYETSDRLTLESVTAFVQIRPRIEFGDRVTLALDDALVAAFECAERIFNRLGPNGRRRV